MTGLFDRVTPGAQNRLPIAGLSASFWQMLEGDQGVDRDAIVLRFQLDGPEAADLDAIIAQVQADLVGGVTREELFHKFTQILNCLELGFMTETQARTKIGI